MHHMIMLIFVSKLLLIYYLQPQPLPSIRHHPFINTNWNSGGGRYSSGSTMAVTTGMFSFLFFYTILMWLLPRSKRNQKKGPRDTTNVSWATVFKVTMTVNAVHWARDSSRAPSVSFFFPSFFYCTNKYIA